MSFYNITKMPSPEELKYKFPINNKLVERKIIFDNELKNILSGKINKFIIIIGPCSADNHDAILEYTDRLNNLNKKLSDKLFIIPRVFSNKPRTDASGYKGLLHQPDPESNPDIKKGLEAIRKLHLDVATYTDFFTADEILYPENYLYLDDILSYVTIGARSVENQQHRLVSSGIDVPVGMKNPTSGNLSVMVNAVYAARNKHQFIYRENEVITDGNEYAHCILRGYTDRDGKNIPNYHTCDMEKLSTLFKARNMENPMVIIDVNHANSNKVYKKQIDITKEIIGYRKIFPRFQKLIKGLMIESYIIEGAQKIGEHIYGKSITDPCLSFYDSEQLLYTIYDNI